MQPLVDLIRAAFAGMAGRIDPPSSAERLTGAAIRRQARIGEVWVTGAPPVACLFLTPREDALYLGKLAVDPVARGQGLARALLDRAGQRARALGLSQLRLQVRVELTENHAFFNRMGFHQTGAEAHPGFDRPTSLVFAKDIAP